MTSTMNRRAILAAAASAAVASPAIAIPLGSPHRDAELLALGERLRSAHVTLSAADDRADARYSEYKERRAPTPEAKLAQRRQQAFGGFQV
jgi:hypothetical protein